MTGVQNDGERYARVVALLEGCVKEELQITSGMHRLKLNEASIQQLTQGVVAEVLYAFKVDWSPDWVKPGEVHAWEEDGRFFARCSVCLLDSPPAGDQPTAEAWARRHEAQHTDSAP